MDTPAAKSAPFLRTPYFERFAQFSPDGKWVAYVSDDSGANEIYVRALPGAQNQVRVSVSGGDVPRWSRDGRQLFFYSNGKMMTANVRANGATLDVTSITPLFDCRAPARFRRLFYDALTVNWPQLHQRDVR